MKNIFAIVNKSVPAVLNHLKIPAQRMGMIFFSILCVSLVLGQLFIKSSHAVPKSTVKAVLFYKSDCRDCEIAIQNILPGYLKKHSSGLRVLAINNSVSEGGDLFLDTLLTLNISPPSRLPILIIGSQVLTGLDEINQTLPKLLTPPTETAVYEWPEVNSIKSLIVKMRDMEQVHFAKWINESSEQGVEDLIQVFKYNFNKDTAGNSVALFVLLGMLGAIVLGIALFLKKTTSDSYSISIVYPILGIVALGIASYLFLSGIMDSELTCGPVGECNTVQQSEYAYLFDVIPVSLLGILSYCVGLICWIQARLAPKTLKVFFVIIAWGGAVVGMGFFVYLTFLEPFIIGASCAWCLSAASLTTLQALISTRSARVAFNEVFNRIF